MRVTRSSHWALTRIPPVLWVILLALCPLGAGADSADSLATYAVEEVVITGELPALGGTVAKLPLSLQSIPASVSVIGGPLMNEQDGVVLGDALGNASGVNVHTGFGVHDFFVVRGFDSLADGLVLTDGAAEPEATFHNLYNLERVEVLKGPGAFLYGANPLSGTVNLVRKRPVFGPAFGRLAGSLGRFSSVRAATDLGWSDPEGGVALRLNGFWRRSDSFRDDKEHWAAALNPALSWRLNESSTLHLNLEYAANDYSPDSGLPITGSGLAGVPRQRSYQSPLDDSEQDIYRLRLDLRTRLTERISLRDKLYVTDFDWPSAGTLLNGVFPDGQGSPQVARTLLLLDDHQTFVGNQLEAVLTFGGSGLEHMLLAGVETAWKSDEFNLDVGMLPSIDLNDPVETAAEPVGLVPGQSTEADARSFVLAPYIVDHLTVGRGLQLFAGGRLDVIDYEDEDSGTSRTYRQLSPLVGAIAGPSDRWSIYASAGQAFGPPSSRVVGDREAETGRQVETGVRARSSDGRLHGSVALYQLEKSDIAIPDEFGVFRETGDQRSRGVEVEIVAHPLRGWRAAASYAFSKAELTDFREVVVIRTQTGSDSTVTDRSGNDAPFAPDHILNIWSGLDLGGGLGAGATLRYVSGQKISPDNAFQLDGVLTLDASLSYRLERARVRLHLQNLTDADYETRGFGSTSVIPADPIGASATVEWEL